MSTAVAKREPAEPNPQLEALQRVASQQTPKSEIRVRTGRGGMQLKYTDGAYVIRTLNAAFGWDWDWLVDGEELLTNNGKPFEVKVRGTLTVRLNGQAVTKMQYGCQPIEFLRNGEAPVSIGDAYKGAATDAMKKCASLLGIALDLYDSDYKAEKYASEPTAMTAAGDIARQYVTKLAQLPDDEPVKSEIIAPGVVWPVKLEGAQPTDKPKVIGPKTQQILGWIKEMGWSAEDLADYIALQFKVNLAQYSDELAYIGALDGGQKYALHQMIEAEFKNRGER